MKKTYKVEVDCANCAAKMEDVIKKIDGISSATLNFMTQKLIVEFDDGVEIDSVMQAAYKVCKKVESDCVIYL